MKLGMIVNNFLRYLKTASSCLYCLYKQTYSCLYFSIVLIGLARVIVTYIFTHHNIHMNDEIDITVKGFGERFFVI